MRGFIYRDCFEREAPYMYARVTGKYNAHQHSVEVIDSVEGDEYDHDNLWYRLSNGGYVWSGAVNIVSDGSAIADHDLDHFLISFRPIDSHTGTPDLGPKIPSTKLSFGPVRLPADPDKAFVREYSAIEFSNEIVKLLEPVGRERPHVFLYMHGYQFLSSLKLDLLTNFVENYISHQSNKIAKVLFFTWPAQGPGRKTVDDRSFRAGAQFTQSGLFEYLETLSRTLTAQGRKLNLIVHSFGHQLLNGMLNSKDSSQLDKYLNAKIFENIFLMAPDITHLAVRTGGVKLENHFSDGELKEIQYDFSKLKLLAKTVHVFHNKYDYLLHVSTKKFLEKKMRRQPSAAMLEEIRKYRNLGNYGKSNISPPEPEHDFIYWDVDKLIQGYSKVKSLQFRFRPLRNGLKRRVDAVWNNSDYREIKFTDTLFNIGHAADHHRYLFTCKQVVDKVQSLL